MHLLFRCGQLGGNIRRNQLLLLRRQRVVCLPRFVNGSPIGNTSVIVERPDSILRRLRCCRIGSLLLIQGFYFAFGRVHSCADGRGSSADIVTRDIVIFGQSPCRVDGGFQLRGDVCIVFVVFDAIVVLHRGADGIVQCGLIHGTDRCGHRDSGWI